MTLTNPKVRNVCYVIYSILNLALGSIVVFCGSTDVWVLPPWVTPATAALAYLGAGLGFVASANTPTVTKATTPAVEAVEEPEPGTVPAV